MPNITLFTTNINLATTTTLTVVENKIPGHSKYITTLEFNKLTLEKFAARLVQTNLTSKNDNANFVRKTDFDDKLKKLNKTITSSKIKHVLVETELKQLQTFDSSLLLVKVTLIMTEHNFI